jgi:hypothetical protein
MHGAPRELSSRPHAFPPHSPIALKIDGTAPQLAPYDSGLIDEIRHIGFHPFIILRTRDPLEILVCRTQNEAGQFARDLASLPCFEESKLLRAIERVLQSEIYDAADLLLLWSEEQVGTVVETAYVGLPADTTLAQFYGYPAFQLAHGDSVGGTALRTRFLIGLFDAYAGTTGNDALRFALMEALAFGLSRALGRTGRHVEASAIVDRAIAHCPSSIHLKAAKRALELKCAGKAVPPRLQKFIGENDDYFRKFVCPEPFQRIDIAPGGEVLVCNGCWCPTAIGDITKEPIESIINSEQAQKIRRSVVDGTYKYCNHLECGPMIQESLPPREEALDSQARARADAGDFRVDGVERLLFAFDESCNLSCPSCRREVRVEKASQTGWKARAIETTLRPLLPRLKLLYVNSAGELFASKLSRQILKAIDDEQSPGLALRIISNGTLFNEAEWNKFPGIHNKVRSIRISTDAARRATFEKLRRPARYDTFLANLGFLRRLRADGVIRELNFSFTYQVDNFREMLEFLAFRDRMGGDLVIFERLLNLGAFMNEEYVSRAVHRPAHPQQGEFMEVIKSPLFRARNVWHDFDFPDIDNMTREEAVARARDRGPAGHMSG